MGLKKNISLLLSNFPFNVTKKIKQILIKGKKLFFILMLLLRKKEILNTAEERGRKHLVYFLQ